MGLWVVVQFEIFQSEPLPNYGIKNLRFYKH